MTTATATGLLRNTVLVGDALTELRRLPSSSLDMVLTSPPYFRQRDYQVVGQLGLEDRVESWVGHLQAVCRELQRVLVPTGTLWLNVGDGYSSHVRQGALLLGPERLALRLAQDGWLLRNKVVWAKANPMPSSVRDRLTCGHEFVYVFALAPRYFFDLDSIRVPHRSQAGKPAIPTPAAAQIGRNEWRGPNAGGVGGLAALQARGLIGHPLGKNPGDVWTIASNTYRSAHHATFPLALAELIIRAGCPERRCRQCRAPWRPTAAAAPEPTCTCRTGSEPGLVLDPFIGAGTTGLAAERLGRDWLGIELNPAFAALAEARIRRADRPAAHSPPLPEAA